MLIDEIEKDLNGRQSYQETHSYISDAIPELKPFLESKVVPVTGDWPTWYFHKKMVCQSNPESLTLVPELGQFHIYLNGIEDVIKQYHPIFNEIYKAVQYRQEITWHCVCPRLASTLPASGPQSARVRPASCPRLRPSHPRAPASCVRQVRRSFRSVLG